MSGNDTHADTPADPPVMAYWSRTMPDDEFAATGGRCGRSGSTSASTTRRGTGRPRERANAARPLIAAAVSILVALVLQFLGLDRFFAGYFFGLICGTLITVWTSVSANPGS